MGCRLYFMVTAFNPCPPPSPLNITLRTLNRDEPPQKKSTPISHVVLLIHHANPASAASTVLHDITHVLYRTGRFMQPPSNKHDTPCLAGFPIFLVGHWAVPVKRLHPVSGRCIRFLSYR